MTSKKCTKCKIVKPLCEFYIRRNRKQTHRSNCKSCGSKSGKTYAHSKNGSLTIIYMSQCNRSKKKGYPKPEYSLKNFIEWALCDKEFHKIYDGWVTSGYKKLLKPSFDRCDDYKGYSLTRLKIMTWGQNKLKSENDIRNGINNKINKPVVQMDMGNNLIGIHHSVTHAARITKGSQGNIGLCCIGERNMADGFRWMFSITDSNNCIRR